MERRFQRRSFAPIKPGEELDVKIEAVGAKGDGIAKVKGFVIFIPGAKEGETLRIKVNKVFKKVGFAEVLGQGNAEAAETSEGTEEESYDDNADEESTEEEF